MTWVDEFKRMAFNTFRKVGMVGLLIDPKVQGVCLPEQFMDQNRVLIHLGDNLPKPISDLRDTELGVDATLNFPGRGPFKVELPWISVVAIGSADSGIFCQFRSDPAMVKGPKPTPKPMPKPMPKPFTIIDGGLGNN